MSLVPILSTQTAISTYSARPVSNKAIIKTAPLSFSDFSDKLIIAAEHQFEKLREPRIVHQISLKFDS